jgi:hypothetical protein
VTLEQAVALISAIFAIASFALSFAVVQRQTRLQFESLRSQIDQQIMAWAVEAIDALADAAQLVKSRGKAWNPDEMADRTSLVCARLSAIADKGRLIFPNHAHQAHGAEKEIAFQGFRPVVLDCLIFAYAQLERVDPKGVGVDDVACAFIMNCRRLFVSEVQLAIDPRRRQKILAELAVQSRAQGDCGFDRIAQLAQELEARHPGALDRKRDAKWVADMKAYARTL